MSETLLFAIIFCGVWALIGIVFLTMGIVMYRNEKKLKENCTEMTYGTVTDIIRNVARDEKGSYNDSFNPLFEYNIGELKYIKESSYGTPQPQYAIGQKVEVYYNPENPNEFYISGETFRKEFAMWFSVAGIASIMIAIISAIIIL